MDLKRGKPLEERFAKFTAALQKQTAFTLSIGDEGALLTYVHHNQVEHFLLASLSSPEEQKTMLEFMTSHAKVPVSILVDVIDQNYTRQVLPGVSSVAIQALAQKKLTKEFAATDLKNCLQVGRLDDGRKDWQYLYINAPFVSPLSDWLNFIMSTPNPLKGIFMLPMESYSLVTQLQTAILASQEEQKPSAYHILLTHNKVSGFRQTAFKGKQVLFTRVVDASMESTAEGAALSIEQELRNALEYLRRLSFQESEGLDIYIVVAEEVKQYLVSQPIAGRRVIILTPFEAANLLKLKNAVTQNARFADILIAACLTQAKPLLPFYTKQTQQLASLESVHQYAFFGTVLLIPTLFALIIMTSIAVAGLSGEIDEVTRGKNQIEEQWSAEQQGSGMTISESYRIIDLVTLHKLLATQAPNPLTILQKFKEMQGENVLVRSVDWGLKEPTGQADAQQMMAVMSGSDTPAPSVMQVVFDVDLYNSGGGRLEGIIESFDLFTKQLQEKFPDYNVGYSNLPQKLSLDTQNTTLPVKVTIIGPKPSTNAQ